MELFESRRTKFLRAFFLLFPALLLVLSCTLFVAGVSSTSDQAVHKEQDALEQALKNGDHPHLCPHRHISQKPVPSFSWIIILLMTKPNS